ncbi:hypothetical protein [Pseudonocardia oceani]|nr:hypothetical protein [Pseudonocardia oceani]
MMLSIKPGTGQFDLLEDDESGAIGELPATVQVREFVCSPLVVV